MKLKTVLIIGAGPGGLATAIEAIELGLSRDQILVLEKGEVPIDAIRRFYPDKKMTLANYKGLPTETHGHLSVFPDLTKAETLVYFDDLIKKYEIPIRYKSEVSKIERAPSHPEGHASFQGRRFRVVAGHDEYFADFVVVGIGILGRPNKPDYKLPPTLKPHLLFDLTSQKVEKQKVLVVGGGDTSSEYCQVLVGEGNDVTLCYRGDSFKRMMQTNSDAVERLRTEGKLRVLLSTEVQEVVDEGGKPKVVYKSGAEGQAQSLGGGSGVSHVSEIFDKIIYSIGGTTPINFMLTAGIECENNWPKLGEAGRTNVDGLYLVGDLVAGKLGGSIITAYNSSFRTAQDIVSRISASR